MIDESHSLSPVFLSSSDATTLDELVEAGFSPNPRRSPPGQSSQVVSLLNLLNHLPEPAEDPARRELLVNITMARVLRDRESSAARIEPAQDPAAPALCEQSAAAIDAIVDADWSATDTDHHQSSAAALTSLLSAAPRATTQQRGSLIERTLGTIQSDIDSNSTRFRLDPVTATSAPPSSGFSIRDLVAVAAMLLIGTAILWPVLVQSRFDINKTATRMNMAQAGFAFSAFAKDHDGTMPQTASRSDKWWNVGDPETSHSANLYRLARDRYATLQDLSCPSNPFAPIQIIDEQAKDWRNHPEVSFSLQLYTTPNPRYNSARTHVVLADRSPVIRRLLAGEHVSPNAPSPNHAGRGQHVLLNDGSVLWLTTPYLPGSTDNIWLPASLERRLKTSANVSGIGAAVPSNSMDDVFVGP